MRIASDYADQRSGSPAMRAYARPIASQVVR